MRHRVLEPARRHGLDLSLAAVTPRPADVEVRRSPHGTWWLAATAEADPVALSNGGVTHAPPEIVRDLRSLRAAGVDFDFIVLAHELPGTWNPGEPVPKMRLAGTGQPHGATTVKA